MAIRMAKTNFGMVEGIPMGGEYADITEFRGIPYAAPPLGALRWRPPQDVQSWEGVRLCDTYPDMAYQKALYKEHQTTSIMQMESYYMPMPHMSEDCLYLNVYTGAHSPGEKQPVFIWYHGGGLTSGYNHEIQNDPGELCRRGIVVVNVAHRLGPFGYLSLPQLCAEQGGKSGNYGLMDQLKALDWITENIAAFGGDPDNITAGGISGGTWKAAAVAAAPQSRGRIKRIIAQSVFRCYMKYASVEEACGQGCEFIRNIGLDPETVTLEELRSLPPDRILKDDLPRDHVIGDMCWDKDLIEYETVLEAFENLPWRVDILSSTTCGEANVFENGDKYYFGHYKVASGAGYDSKVRLDTKEEFYAHYRELLGDLYEKYDFESLCPVTDATAWKTARTLASLGLTRPGKGGGERSLMKHRMISMYLGRLHPDANYYTYLFTHILPITEEYLGTNMDPEYLMAYHGSDPWFTFNSLREGRPPHRPWREEDYRLGKLCCDYWANFIRTGNPNGSSLPYWPTANENFGWLKLDVTPEGHEGLEDNLDRLIAEYTERVYGIKVG